MNRNFSHRNNSNSYIRRTNRGGLGDSWKLSFFLRFILLGIKRMNAGKMEAFTGIVLSQRIIHFNRTIKNLNIKQLWCHKLHQSCHWTSHIISSAMPPTKGTEVAKKKSSNWKDDDKAKLLSLLHLHGSIDPNDSSATNSSDSIKIGLTRVTSPLPLTFVAS